MPNWDEADHPRVPSGDTNGGQFTDKAARAARKAAGVETIDDTILEWAEKIVGEERENMVVLDGETGETLWHEVGNKSSVGLPESQQHLYEGNIIIHSHPKGNGQARFSEPDLFFGKYWKGKKQVLIAGDWMVSYTDTGLHKEFTSELVREAAYKTSEYLAKIKNKEVQKWAFLDAFRGDWPQHRQALIEGYKYLGLDLTYTKWR